MVEIAFTKVKLPYGWLGNMSPHSVSYDGIDYPTAEALFQSLRFDSIEMRLRIATERSPMTAKMLAKKHRSEMNIVPISDIDVENMRLVIRTKIEQHPHLRVELIFTGDARIIEDCTNRQRGSGLFWGAAKQADGTWKGANILGVLWQELRSKLVGAS